MLRDATGVGLAVGDRVGTVTGGQNSQILVGTVTKIHEVKATVAITFARRTGTPVSTYAKKLPEVGSSVQLNAYRIFKLPPQERP